ncbi:MAG: porin, partial [Thermoguttaceae bacterium]
MKKVFLCLPKLGAMLVMLGATTAFAVEYDGRGFPIPPTPPIQGEWSPNVSQASNQQTAPSVPTVNQYQYSQPYAPYSANASAMTLEDLSKEVADLKAELKKKSDKPDTKKAFGSPKISGRVFVDSLSVANQNTDSIATGTGKNSFGFREARLGFSGTGYEFLDYKIELGFENFLNASGTTGGSVNFKDVFLGINHVPALGYVRIGNQYVEDGGSELCNGTTNYTFMELPAPGRDTFTSRRLGVSSRHLFANDRGRLYMGVFDATDVSNLHRAVADAQGVTFNTRYTYAPMYKQDGRCLSCTVDTIIILTVMLESAEQI